MKKNTKKAIENFEKELRSYLAEIKAVVATDSPVPSWKEWDVSTVVGRLRVTIMDDNVRSEVVSIFGRFFNKELVNAHLKNYTNRDFNPYSLKFNFHEYTPEECLRVFKSEMEKIATAKQKATTITCPYCNSENFCHHQPCTKISAIEAIHPDGYVDVGSVVDTEDSDDYHLECGDCGASMSTDEYFEALANRKDDDVPV